MLDKGLAGSINKYKISKTPVGLPPVTPLTSEWLVLNFLEPFTPSDIKIAIDKNIDLLELIVDNPEDKEKLSQIALQFDVSWTVSDVLFWFSQRRFDLYQVLTTKKGIKWLITHWLKRNQIKTELTKKEG